MEEKKQTPGIPDELIYQKILELLRKDPSIDASKIIVEVNNGTAILRGGIDTDAEKQRSEDLARTVEGVNLVENHLHIDLGIAHALSSLAAHIQGDIIKDEEEDEDENKKK
ncbi:MAG: BON domain-containing protein [Chitinophagaceae bacterium]